MGRCQREDGTKVRIKRDKAATIAHTERKAWTMSALMELRGLSLMTIKICSSFSKLMKLPNQDFLASLLGKTRKEATIINHLLASI